MKSTVRLEHLGSIYFDLKSIVSSGRLRPNRVLLFSHRCFKGFENFRLMTYLTVCPAKMTSAGLKLRPQISAEIPAAESSQPMRWKSFNKC
ncbi:MAG: hypothetical protein ACLSE6_04195 [Alphaproteobacteria bacterium]